MVSLKHKLDPNDTRIVLVTGCTSGIGLSLARKLWRSSLKVVVTSRKSSLHKISNEPFKDCERFLIRPLDITSYVEQRELLSEIGSIWGNIDILVNNAGISYRACIEDMDERNELKQLKTNYLGPINLIRLVLPGMRKKGSGSIINVSSVGGMMAMPTMGSYSASKFALEGASEALWYEMKPWNIKVSLVQPGFINSSSFEHVYLTPKSKDLVDSPYANYYSNMCHFIEKLMHMAWATPDSIADTIIRVICTKNPPLRVPATIDALLFSALRRYMPRRMYHAFLFRNLPGIKDWNKKND